jgi:hypothetical protein
VVERGKIAQPLRDIRMVRTERFLVDRQRARVERFCFTVAARDLKEQTKVAQRFGNIGVVRAERLFADRQGAHRERLGLGVTPLHAVEKVQDVEGMGDVGMIGAILLLAHREHALGERGCVRVFARAPQLGDIGIERGRRVPLRRHIALRRGRPGQNEGERETKTGDHVSDASHVYLCLSEIPLSDPAASRRRQWCESDARRSRQSHWRCRG